MTILTICSQNINVVDNLFSLNDLHKASGNQVKHKPSNFLQNQETKALIAEIESENYDDGIPSSKIQAVKTIVGKGKKQGTYVCKELVYRYAMWISAKFSLMVIRAFDSMVSRSDSQQREVLRKACEKLATRNMLVSDAYILVGKQFGYEGGIKDIPTPLLPEATAFVYEMILRLKPTQSSEPTTPQETNEVKMFWKCVGLTQYHETGKHLDQLLKTLHKAEDQLRQVNKSRSLIYDALAEPKHPVGGQEKVEEINQKALAFIQRQNAMKV